MTGWFLIAAAALNTASGVITFAAWRIYRRASALVDALKEGQ